MNGYPRFGWVDILRFQHIATARQNLAAYIDGALLLRVTPLRTAPNGQADFEDLVILLSLIQGVGLLQLELQVLQGLRLRLQGQSETDESKQKQQYFSHEKRLNK